MKRFVALLAVAVLALALLSGALADTTPTPAPTPEPTRVPEPSDGQVYQYLLFDWDPNGHLLELKGILNDRKWYVSTVPKENISSNFFDRDTLNTINACCRKHGLPTSEFGIVQESYVRIMNRQIVGPDDELTVGIDTPAENIPPIKPYDTGNASVTRLQQKLSELRYDVRDWRNRLYHLTPGSYDEEMRAMLQDYVRVRNFQWDGQEIPGELQSMILNDNIAKQDREVQDYGKTAQYFMKKVKTLGIWMPRFAEWMVVLLLLAAAVILGIYFFRPAPAEGAAPAAATPQGSSVEFTIEYNGERRVHRLNIADTLSIGRAFRELPLDVTDQKISKQHCEICRSGNGYILRDHSTNGTVVNGRPYSHSEVMLHAGDRIKIGSHNITIRF